MHVFVMLSIPEVNVGQRWKRPDGTVVEVREIRIFRGSREALLVPVDVPAGKRARTSWKWDAAIRSQMVPVRST